MSRRAHCLFVLAGVLLSTLGLGCAREPLSVVAAMYHHWWVPSRWVDEPRNHTYEPLMGHYDNADENIVRQHVAWAKQHGIDTMVLDLWITDRDRWWVVPNTRVAADVFDQEGMKYFFLIDGWYEFTGVHPDPYVASYEVGRRVNELVGSYFARPGYLRQDGKPVLYFYNCNGSPWPFSYYLGLIRGQIEHENGPIFMTGDLWNEYEPDPWRYLDLLMDYTPYTPECGQNDYACQIAHQRDMWRERSSHSKPWAPTALPGFDDHYVRQGNPILVLNADFFRNSIRTALAYPQYHNDGMKWLFVCSWNEWHEGSQIEPSTASYFPDPEFLLDALEEEVDAYRAGPF